MGKVPNIIPITDLRQDAASVLKRVKDTKEPVIIDSTRSSRSGDNEYRRVRKGGT